MAHVLTVIQVSFVLLESGLSEVCPYPASPSVGSSWVVTEPFSRFENRNMKVA